MAPGSGRGFTNVTLPMLAPTLLFTTAVLTSRAFQAYGEVDLLTQGGPRPEDLDHDTHLPDLRSGVVDPQ